MTIFSWAVSAVLLGVIVLILFRRERETSTYLLVSVIAAGALLETADNLFLGSGGGHLIWKRAAIALEGSLSVLLFLFSLFYARKFSWGETPLLMKILLVLAPAPPLGTLFLPPERLFYSPDFISERMLFLSNGGFCFYIIVFIYLVAAIYNLEVTFRYANRPEQWQIKFTVIGVGALLGLLIFYYSQGLLYRSINMNLVPLRSLALLVAAVILTYSLVRRDRKVRLRISKEMAFKSVVLTIVGSYLLLLGLMGEGLRYFGDASQQVIFVSLVFVGCIVLAAVLLSEQMKRKIKVLISKNFFENKYDYRVQWLNFTSRLAESRNSDELDSAILSGFCDTFAMGAALLYLWSPEQNLYFNRGVYQSEHCPVSFKKDNPLIGYLVKRGWVFNASYLEPAVIEFNSDFLLDEKVSFIVPIFAGENLEGFIALLRPINPGEEYNYEDYDLMKTLARQAAFALSSARFSEQLAVAREMEAVGRVTAFVMHDLKNLVYSLSLLTANAKDYIGDPEFQEDMLETLSNTVGKMKAIISKLKELPERHELNLVNADLLEIAREAVASLAAGGITIHGTSVHVCADVQELGKVAINLLVNALDAIGDDGTVSVQVGSGVDLAYFSVTDTGCGMSAEFIRNKLFAPFSTTKSKGLGIGLFQCRQIVESHDGRIEVDSAPGKGSTFTVWLPIVDGCTAGIEDEPV